MPIFLRIALLTIFGLLLMGCKHSIASKDSPQDKTKVTQTPLPNQWHDGSTGGVFGIGENWSIELLSGDYATVVDIQTMTRVGATELIPAEIEWVRDDSVNLSTTPVMVTKLISVPAEYMTVTETVVVEPEVPEYYLTDATYNFDRSVARPRFVRLRHKPAITKQVTARVIKTPARIIERRVPIEPRVGYRPVVKSEARNVPVLDPIIEEVSVPRIVEVQPWRFVIKNPDRRIAHTFDDYDDLTAFIESLN